ncbi:unnamed protein product [Cyprideis torosa]|uniref:beta-ketoacyl-[acyl-carrier-protein] synthase I n=1 Tax=Cyprideis torosa TaxID=163714 RepID=A0A7R8W3U9_9CRUS|nr:unnamed protein product [Cyprideis torosa]CAG0883296.1 unnamed protein product [Cyprideis torosa]
MPFGETSSTNLFLSESPGKFRKKGKAVSRLIPYQAGLLTEERLGRSSSPSMQPTKRWKWLAGSPSSILFLSRQTDTEKERTGVAIGSGIAGLDAIAEASASIKSGHPKRISPFFVPGILPNMAAGQVGIHYGIRGPTLCTATACAAGAHSIGDAARLIQYGDADVMIAGGSEACISPISLTGFHRARALATSFNDEPHEASRPFDSKREGFVVSEGAGIVVLEELEHARRRGAKIYAEILGYGLTGDGHHVTAPREDGKGVIACMSRAMEDGGVGKGDIGYINAHATSTPLGDAAEAVAIRNLFQQNCDDIWVSSTKGSLGHLLGKKGLAAWVV